MRNFITGGIVVVTISNEEKMELLLKQVELPEEMKESFFQNSSLEKVIVYKKEKRWNLHIKIEKVLPFEVYLTFINKIKQSFEQIADIKLTLLTEDSSCEEKEFQLYWSYFVQSLSKLLPSHMKTLEQQPIVTDNQIELSVSTEAEAVSLKRKIDNVLQQFCEA